MSAVLYSAADGVATLTLNRPESRNALNLEMCEGILEAARAATSDDSIKIFFVKAKGPAFCAGAFAGMTRSALALASAATSALSWSGSGVTRGGVSEVSRTARM